MTVSLQPTSLKLRVFISSVQKELIDEREQLKVLLGSDPFLVRHTVPKLFEKYPAPLRPNPKAYLELLRNCQIYVLIIGREYGGATPPSPTHQEYELAQQLRLPTLVCVKGDQHFEREAGTVRLFAQVKADGHTYSRFQTLEELNLIARERLIEHIQQAYELAPSADDNRIAEAAVSSASLFDRQRLTERFLHDLVPVAADTLARALNSDADPELENDPREQLLLERGYLWFNATLDQAQPTAAGLLLAGKDPSSLFVQCRVQVDVYPGTDYSAEAFFAESLRANLPATIEHAVALIKRHTRSTPRVLGLKRIDLPEYPEVALREALVNAIAHRDYEDTSQHVLVEVFRDRVVISNPGQPVGHPALKKLAAGKARSRSRNPLLSQGLVFLRLMEERGTGIRRMRAAMLDHGLEPPHVELEQDRFVLTLPGPGDDLSRLKTPASAGDAALDSLHDTLNPRQLQILTRLAGGEELTSAVLQKDFAITRDTVVRDMAALLELGRAAKIGKARATRYVYATPKSSEIVR